MLNQILLELYERDLAKLKEEISAYSNEADLWKIDGEILNSAGNLCLHLNGNLQHFFGAILGGTGYVRDRDGEFANKNVSREKMLTDIEATLGVIRSTLSRLTDDDFTKTYPIEVFGKPMTTGWFLTHLATHLNWHLGQIDYHRRLVAAP
jgi:uncharacterized damage-inducible protein DinB